MSRKSPNSKLAFCQSEKTFAGAAVGVGALGSLERLSATFAYDRFVVAASTPLRAGR